MFVPFTESFMGDSLLQPMQNLNQSLVTSFLGRHGVFAGKTVWSMPERFVIYIVYKKALYKYASFPFPYFSSLTSRILFWSLLHCFPDVVVIGIHI